ncbi:MAG: type II secretion system F family protein [Puniceicoccales bacterium]|jgi:type II secretory pathway component PulF|nr:type II secretion system F family protein [Puniceicoccales bacterium]
MDLGNSGEMANKSSGINACQRSLKVIQCKILKFLKQSIDIFKNSPTLELMKFIFKAINMGDEIVSSDIEAPSRGEAIALLFKKKFRIVGIFEENSAGSKKSFWHKLMIFLTKKRESISITNLVLLTFFEKLTKMVSSGLTLTDSISSIDKRTKSAAEKMLTSSVLADILAGVSFSDALRRVGGKIDGNVYSIILIGESSGNLAKALADVTSLLKSNNALKKQLISSLIYPSFLICLVIGVMMLFTFVLMPGMKSFISDLGGKIPSMVKFLESMANCFVYLIPAAIIAIIVAIIALPRIRKTKIGRYKTDAILLKIPPFSSIVSLVMKTNLSNLMATLLGNGINTSEALELAQLSISNKVLLEQFINAKNDILDGKTVCASFEKYRILDGEACDFIEIGEKTGDLAVSFRDIHKIYADDLKSSLKKIVISISATAMAVAFTLVGLLAFGIVQTIMGASNAAANI